MITRGSATTRNIGYGLLVVAASIVLASVADAQAQTTQTDPVHARLTVEAEAGCATQASIAAHLHARSRRIAFVDDHEGVPRIRIAIGEATRGDRVAELVVDWPDGRRSERRLHAGSCSAAREALALLLAMTLDPSALATAPTTGDAPVTSDAPATRDAPATGDAAATDDAAVTGDSAVTGDASSTTSAEGPPSRDARADASALHPLGIAALTAGIHAQLVSGPAPRAMPGFGVYARLSMHGSGFWAPALQLQLAHGWASDRVETGGDADFTLDGAALDLCPLGLQQPPLWAHACVAGTLGRLTASGSNTYAPRTRRELWSSLGGRLLLSLGLGSRVELQGGFGLAAPLSRYRFAFRPNVFHRVPGVSLAGHLGAGLRFP